jgi:predicted ATP-dependent serine protease
VVPASAVLVGGDPGIGKSTLVLSPGSPGPREAQALYVSGEESSYQIKMRPKGWDRPKPDPHFSRNLSEKIFSRPERAG